MQYYTKGFRKKAIWMLWVVRFVYLYHGIDEDRLGLE